MSRKYRKSDGTGALVMSFITLFFSLLLAFGVVTCASKGFKDWTFLPWVNAEIEAPADNGNETPGTDDNETPGTDVGGTPTPPSFEY